MGKNGVIDITDANFKKEIIESDIPAMVDFWAEWCMPCRMIAPFVEQVAAELHGKVKVGKLDVDGSANIPTDLGVMNIPTIVFFKDGKEVGRSVGVVSKNDLLRKAREVFGGIL